jgi:hypothetical protein
MTYLSLSLFILALESFELGAQFFIGKFLYNSIDGLELGHLAFGNGLNELGCLDDVSGAAFWVLDDFQSSPQNLWHGALGK